MQRLDSAAVLDAQRADIDKFVHMCFIECVSARLLWREPPPQTWRRRWAGATSTSGRAGACGDSAKEAGWCGMHRLRGCKGRCRNTAGDNTTSGRLDRMASRARFVAARRYRPFWEIPTQSGERGRHERRRISVHCRMGDRRCGWRSERVGRHVRMIKPWDCWRHDSRCCRSSRSGSVRGCTRSRDAGPD